MKVTILIVTMALLCVSAGASASAIYTDMFTTDGSSYCCRINPGPWDPPTAPIVQYEGSDLMTGFGFANFPVPPQSSFTEVWMQATFAAPVATFTETIDCCNYLWQGTLGPGNIAIAATVLVIDQNNNPTYSTLQFAGTITDGAFWGAYGNYCGLPPYCDQLQLIANFDGTWSNGWTSTGTLNFFLDSDVGAALTLVTDSPGLPTPESSPLALGMLGASIIAARYIHIVRR